MNTVPNMISVKDLEYIKDMLNWNFIAEKKANHYLEHIQDPDVKKLLTKTRDMHKKHFDAILNILK